MTHGRRRDMPADFAERAVEMSNARLIRHYQTGHVVVLRWLSELGDIRRPWSATGQREMPVDFLEKAEELGYSPKLLRRHYGCGSNKVSRWLDSLGIVLRPGVKNLGLPDDFAKLAPSMTFEEARHHYGRGKHVLNRWRAAAGISFRLVHPPASSGVVRMADGKYRGTRKRSVTPGDAPVERYQRDMSLAGQAADFLKPLCAVYRCNSLGRYDEKGDFWRRGNAVLTPSELIDRAKSKGFGIQLDIAA